MNLKKLVNKRKDLKKHTKLKSNILMKEKKNYKLKKELLNPLRKRLRFWFFYLKEGLSLFFYFYQTSSVLLQPCKISFFHISLASSNSNYSLLSSNGGSLQKTLTIFPESTNIYLLNWSLLALFSVNLLTSDLCELINQ